MIQDNPVPQAESDSQDTAAYEQPQLPKRSLVRDLLLGGVYSIVAVLIGAVVWGVIATSVCPISRKTGSGESKK